MKSVALSFVNSEATTFTPSFSASFLNTLARPWP
ncbi:MAG: hypothetical protein GAK34_03715 [Delftia tsuruhatensis]|nr:MAG: hypothetical protein GAK34_03715 [Delftia tsuruhatensis]